MRDSWATTKLWQSADSARAKSIERLAAKLGAGLWPGIAENAFGVFQEVPHDIVWRFAPEAAASAKEYLFHPSQTMEEQSDGSLVVRFRAGGLREMYRHLFTWGGAVEVLAPPELIRLYQELRP